MMNKNDFEFAATQPITLDERGLVVITDESLLTLIGGGSGCPGPAPSPAPAPSNACCGNLYCPDCGRDPKSPNPKNPK